VEPGVTSHEACLAAVRESNVFILLIGTRFGGAYKDQNKSVTWREWDEAMQVGLHPIVLIQTSANELAKKIYKKRSELLAASPTRALSDVEREIHAMPEFADDATKGHHKLAAVQRFIDDVRKGHRDNWIHEWDGTVEGAMSFIAPRLSAMFSSYQRSEQRLAGRARQQYVALGALAFVAKVHAEVLRKLRDGSLRSEGAVKTMLLLCQEKKSELFGFRDSDRHNFAIHVRDGDEMMLLNTVRHSDIPNHNRRWKIGAGHIGIAVAQNALLVTGDLRQSDGWSRDGSTDEDDAEHYASVVTVPLYLGGDDASPDATFTVTSSRRHHFDDLDQVEVLTAAAMGNIFSAVIGGDLHGAGAKA
jgi:hypothetical protein